MNTNKNSKSNETPVSLEEVRKSLKEIENERTSTGLSNEQRATLEETSITLRAIERSLIEKTQKEIINDFEQETFRINLQAKEIRALVRKLNKFPKALDITESVIKECVKILKVIAKWSLILLFCVLIFSCATISKTQLKKVNEMTVQSDSISIAPGIIFQELSNIRRERGLIYVASLQDTENKVAELNALAKAEKKDNSIAQRANVYLNVLNSYLKALRSLSAESRWRQNGVELRGIGRNVDSLLIAYNTLKWDEEIKTGLPRTIGKTTGYLTEQYSKRRQRYLVKQYIETGDTIVSVCCDAIINLLRKEGFRDLIDNEEEGLEINYRSYINATKAYANQGYDLSIDRKYLELKTQLNNIRILQSKCATALTSLKKAHHQLLIEMEKPRSYEEYSSEIFELSDQALAVKQLISEL
jgi:hypothetical protein